MSDSNKVLKRYIYKREAEEAAARFRTLPDGRRCILRFSPGQRIEHAILLTSVSILSLTGLAQAYSTVPIAMLVLNLLGGIESVRQFHHFFAIVLVVQSVYHVLSFLRGFWRGEPIPKIIPTRGDLGDVFQMLRLNLGISQKYPRFDRYNFEQKADYWGLLIGVIVLGITGLMQWFPIATTYYLPGWVIPVGRVIHKWQAVFLVTVMITWHLYHSCIKKLNTSIFTGMMSLEDMQSEHPLELAYLDHAAALTNNSTWPVLVEIPLEEMSEPIVEIMETHPPTATEETEKDFVPETATETIGEA